MKEIIYKTESGIAIIHPTNEFIFETIYKLRKLDANKDLSEETIDQFFWLFLAKKDIPHIIDGKLSGWDKKVMSYDDYLKLPLPEYKIVDESEIMADRTFRNAWNYDLKEDIPKSKEIWKDKLRADRAPLLEALDVDYMKALELKDSALQIDIVAQKQVLRDITSKVDAAKTITAIKKIKL